MKSSNRPGRSTIASVLKNVAELAKAKSKVVKQQPTVGAKPLDPPDLYQDAGGGYNTDFTSRQK